MLLNGADTAAEMIAVKSNTANGRMSRALSAARVRKRIRPVGSPVSLPF